MDVILTKKGDRRKRVFVNAVGELVFEKNSGAQVLCSGVTDDFDLCVNADGGFDVFVVSKKGALWHIKVSEDDIHTGIVLENKTGQTRIRGVRVFALNYRFHVFYCLDRSEKLVVHHIVQDDDYHLTPEVIDSIGDRCIYDVALTDTSDIVIIYQSKENNLVMRRFVYSSKSYLAPRKVAERDVRSLCLLCTEDRVFASYVSRDEGRYSAFVCDVSNGSETVAAKVVSPRSQPVLYSLDGNLCVQWTENSMCFEVQCGYDMDSVSISNLGKSAGVARIRTFDGICHCDRANLEPSGKFFRNSELIIYPKANEGFMPSGHSVDELSRRYIEVLGKKNEFEDFAIRLDSMEETLQRLVSLVQRALEDKVNDNEYNKEDNIKEEQN